MVNLDALERPNNRPLKCLRRDARRIRDKEKELFGDKGFFGPDNDESMTWYEPEGLEDLVAIQPPQSQRDAFGEYINLKLYVVVRWLDEIYHRVCQNAIPRNAVCEPF